MALDGEWFALAALALGPLVGCEQRQWPNTPMGIDVSSSQGSAA